jgi:hypothetical protein
MIPLALGSMTASIISLYFDKITTRDTFINIGIDALLILLWWKVFPKFEE